MAGISVKFYPHRSKDKVYLYCELYFNKTRIKKNTGIQFSERLWDKKKKRFKSSATNTTNLNSFLHTIESHMVTFYNNKISHMLPLLKEDFKNELERTINPSKSLETFFDYFREFIERSKTGIRLSNGNQIKKSTIDSYLSTYNHLKNFVKKENYQLEFFTVGDVFAGKFSTFLIQNNLSDNSIGKVVKIVKTFMGYAYEQQWHTSVAYKKGLKVIQKEVDSIYLTIVEVNRIRNLINLDDGILKYRDLFLFQIDTGVRVSDLFNLKPENFDKSQQTLTFKMLKTTTTVTVAYNEISKEMLEKYNYQLPKECSQVYNRKIKEICKMAEINQDIILTSFRGKERVEKRIPKYEAASSHTARRTFITWLIHENVPLSTVCRLSGHKSIKSLQKYIRSTTEDVVAAHKKYLEDR